MRLLHLPTCDFMVYEDYKISLKFVFPIHGINFRTQHLACSPIYHRFTTHHNILLKSLPCEFPYRITHQLLIIYFLINDLLLSKFIQVRLTDGGMRTKNNLLVPCDGVFDGFFKLFLFFIHFRQGIFNIFASSYSDVLFIYL